MLGQHPQVVCRGEVFYFRHADSDAGNDNNESGRIRMLQVPRRDDIVDPDPGRVVARFEQLFLRPAKACGFRFKFPAQFNLFPEVVQGLDNISSLRIIALSRRNVLKQAISRQNMLRLKRMTGLHHIPVKASSDEFLPANAFRVDIPNALNYARQLMRNYSKMEELLVGMQETKQALVIKVEYEDLLADRAGTMRRLFKFLNVDQNVDVEQKLVKATPDDLSVAVENYDELKKAVAGTELQDFLYS